jgi:hypothetical protein
MGLTIAVEPAPDAVGILPLQRVGSVNGIETHAGEESQEPLFHTGRLQFLAGGSPVAAGIWSAWSASVWTEPTISATNTNARERTDFMMLSPYNEW